MSQTYQIALAAFFLLTALAIVTTDFVNGVRKDNAALRGMVAFYRSAPVRRCMRFAASKGYNPYDSHAVQARCFRMQAGGRAS